jgi:hypothetical protein
MDLGEQLASFETAVRPVQPGVPLPAGDCPEGFAAGEIARCLHCQSARQVPGWASMVVEYLQAGQVMAWRFACDAHRDAGIQISVTA